MWGVVEAGRERTRFCPSLRRRWMVRPPPWLVGLAVDSLRKGEWWMEEKRVGENVRG